MVSIDSRNLNCFHPISHSCCLYEVRLTSFLYALMSGLPLVPSDSQNTGYRTNQVSHSLVLQILLNPDTPLFAVHTLRMQYME